MNLIVDYILNIFLTSHKKHLFITGSKNSGKTTFFNLIKEKLEITRGITTFLVENECVYLKDNLTQMKVKIGLFNSNANNYGRPMTTIKEGFIDLGIPVINDALRSNEEWFSFDEIGYLECQVPLFLDALYELLDQKRVFAAIRKKDTEFKKSIELRDDVCIIDFDDINKRFGCIIMASGMSKRYGENKLFEVYNGQTFFEHVIDITSSIFEKRVVVTRNKEVADLCHENNIDVILHDYPYRNDMIRLGMSKMKDMDYCMFIGCDQPLLKKESLKKMVLSCVDQNDKIMQMCYEDKIALPTMFASCYFDDLEQLPIKKGGSYVINQHQEQVCFVECSDRNELFDIDTKEDYKRLVEEIGE